MPSSRGLGYEPGAGGRGQPQAQGRAHSTMAHLLHRALFGTEAALPSGGHPPSMETREQMADSGGKERPTPRPIWQRAKKILWMLPGYPENAVHQDALLCLEVAWKEGFKSPRPGKGQTHSLKCPSWWVREWVPNPPPCLLP